MRQSYTEFGVLNWLVWAVKKTCFFVSLLVWKVKCLRHLVKLCMTIDCLLKKIMNKQKSI